MASRKQLATLACGLLYMGITTGCKREETTIDKPIDAQPATSEVRIANGMMETELLAALGEPIGIISDGSKKTLMYDGIQIEVMDGRVVNLPDNFSAQLKEGRKERAKKKAFIAKQKKKGLVFYDGEWGSSAANRYNVTSVPNVRVFDSHGNMVAPPTSNLGKIDANIRRAKKN